MSFSGPHSKLAAFSEVVALSPEHSKITQDGRPNSANLSLHNLQHRYFSCLDPEPCKTEV